MKTQSMSIKQFMNREKEPFSIKVEKHIKKYGIVYKVAGLSIIFLTTGTFAFADDGLGIDHEARKLYRQLINIGKWVIVFKGGIDIIKSMGNGDIESAKKSFFGYLLTYLFLLGLPYGLDKVDEIVNHVTVPTSGGM